MDDGGGAFISWKAIEFLKKMNLRPARTIRLKTSFVFENGQLLKSGFFPDQYCGLVKSQA